MTGIITLILYGAVIAVILLDTTKPRKEWSTFKVVTLSIIGCIVFMAFIMLVANKRDDNLNEYNNFVKICSKYDTKVLSITEYNNMLADQNSKMLYSKLTGCYWEDRK